MLKRIFTFLFLFSFLILMAQKGKNYKIELKVKGIEDSVLYLANYYGDKTFLVDTAQKKGKNTYLFEGKKWLDGGIYIVVGEQKNTIFEFLISDSQYLKFDSDRNNLIEKMKVKGSNENSLFFRYLAYSNIQIKQLKAYQEKLKKVQSYKDSVAFFTNKIEVLNQDIIDYKEAIIEAYPDAFISHFFLAMKSPETKYSALDSKEDSIQAFRNYKKHYWDYINFEDDRLIRTPVFHNKLDYYFKAIAHPSPDSLIQEIDTFLNRLDEKSEMYKHSLWYLTLRFDQTNRMGYDAILVHFADQYYAKGKAPWLNPGVLKNILNEAKKRRNSLIGKQGPNLVMQDLNSTPVSMYDIEKDYTILYFWDPKCGHCKVETPKLATFYKQNAEKLNLEVFAVCADTNMLSMKNYIQEKDLNWINVNGPRSYTQDFHELYNVYSTPFIFVLDKNKTIIAKHIKSDQLLDFISNYKKIKKDLQ